MDISWRIENFDLVPSTMDIAHERARDGAREGLVIVAKDQSAGRGRRGNVWEAQTGNLYFSLVLRPTGSPQAAGQYSFIAANALADTVQDRLKAGYQYQHKWPNDGLLNGKKFAGILLETKLKESGQVDYLIAGVGINIVSAPEGRAFFNEAAKVPLTSVEFLDLYLSGLKDEISVYRKEGFSPVRDKWLRAARGINEAIAVLLPNEEFKGIFHGLNENGALLLGLAEGGQKVIHSGEVFFGKEI